MTTAPPSRENWAAPELGPSLGRMVDWSSESVGALGVSLDGIRLALVNSIFELAGAARTCAGVGDLEGAVASLGRPAWLAAWERAVGGVASLIAGAARAGFEEAAKESHYPLRRVRTLTLTQEEMSAMAARLGRGGATFVDALERLEQAAHAPGRTAAAADEWRDALTAAARRLESAWLALEAAAVAEQEWWAREVSLVRGWHRPTWPLWTVTALVVAAASYLGLVLGGYLPVSPMLAGFASFWWTWP